MDLILHIKHGGSMTSYAITMSFGELQPIYAGDFNAA